jgi:hypothetical protein
MGKRVQLRWRGGLKAKNGNSSSWGRNSRWYQAPRSRVNRTGSNSQKNLGGWSVKTTQYNTQPAAHSQDTNTGRGKGKDGDYERRKEDTRSSFYSFQIPVLLLVINNSNIINRISVQ